MGHYRIMVVESNRFLRNFWWGISSSRSFLSDLLRCRVWGAYSSNMSTHLATQVGDYLMPWEAYVPKVFTFSGNHKTEREDFGRLCSNRTVQIQWLQFPVLPLDLSFDLLLPLSIGLGWGIKWVGLQLCSFRWEGWHWLISVFFFKLTFS